MQTPDTVTQPAAFRLRSLLLAGTALALLAGCNGGPFDIDFRDMGGSTLDTTEAALNPPNRPRPDDRGVISYPNYQVVVAQRDDTVRSIAGRLGLEAETLARYNGIAPDVALRRDEVIALPARIADATGGGAAASPIQPGTIDVSSIATAAIDRAGPTTTTALPPAPAAAAAPAVAAGQPIRHQVARGETPYSIARLYNVPVRSIAEWNGLGSDLAVREGQYLLIPASGATTPPVAEPVTPPPGAGSVAPVPPSAAAPLPAESPPPATAPATPPTSAVAATPPTPDAPDIGAQPAAPARASQMVYPVQGSIIRAYARGRNDGIDIGAPAGTEVKAAAAGTVAAVTTNTEGIQIVVIRHADNLLTVYTHLDRLTVAKDETVRQGQVIGRVREGAPSFLHFEVRRGMESADPAGFLP